MHLEAQKQSTDDFNAYDRIFHGLLKAHLQPTGFACRRTIFIYENPAKAEIYSIRSL